MCVSPRGGSLSHSDLTRSERRKENISISGRKDTNRTGVSVSSYTNVQLIVFENNCNMNDMK